eukprot:scaffold163791_cov15-Tisochrysis_lutea.AAC.1
MAGRRAVVGPLSATGSQVAELSMPLPSSIEIYPCISGSHTIPQALAPCTPCCQGTRIFLIARAAYSFLQHRYAFPATKKTDFFSHASNIAPPSSSQLRSLR